MRRNISSSKKYIFVLEILKVWYKFIFMSLKYSFCLIYADGVIPNTVQEHQEDVLQMALRMASEMPNTEQAMDLENSIAPSAINPGEIFIFQAFLRQSS
jgi:hypothetical protein